jgi:hypothetical protein
MIVPLIPFSRVRVVVGPGARDRVVRNRRTMSSVIIGMMTFMTCMVPAESSLSMPTHQHSASVFAAEVHPIAYLLLAAGALALTVFMLHLHRGREATAAELHRDLQNMLLLRQRLNRAPTDREIEAERQRLYVLQYIQDHGYSPVSPPQSSPIVPVPVLPLPSEYPPVSPPQSPPVVPISDNEYAPGPNTFADRVNNPIPLHLQIELARGHAMAIVGPTIDVNDSDSGDAEDAVPAPAPRIPPHGCSERFGLHRQYQRFGRSSRGTTLVAAMAVPTPRSLRYNRRSGHLQLALLMCCFGEVQSSAIILSTPAPLYGPLAI